MNALLMALTFCWVLLVIWMRHKWTAARVFKTDNAPPGLPSLAVIVPFRNEAAHLSNFIEDVTNQDFPEGGCEVFFMDDGSTDDGYALIERLLPANPRFRVIRQLPGRGKKAAITEAIARTEADFILTLDADMRINPAHFRTIIEFAARSGKEFLILPIEIRGGRGWLSRFQTIEFDSLMGTTAAFALAGRAVMCNGGNLAFSRTLFYRLDGYAGNEHILSGDDIFLLQKARLSCPESIAWVHSPNAVALTFPKETPGEFLNQRIRWGSKTTLYRDPIPISLAAFVLLLNLLLVCSPFLIVFGLMNPWVAGLCFLFKIAVDGWFLLAIGQFFGRKTPGYVLISGLCHPLYITITAAAGMFIRPHWKGR